MHVYYRAWAMLFSLMLSYVLSYWRSLLIQLEFLLLFVKAGVLLFYLLFYPRLMVLTPKCSLPGGAQKVFSLRLTQNSNIPAPAWMLVFLVGSRAHRGMPWAYSSQPSSETWEITIQNHGEDIPLSCPASSL